MNGSEGLLDAIASACHRRSIPPSAWGGGARAMCVTATVVKRLALPGGLTIRERTQSISIVTVDEARRLAYEPLGGRRLACARGTPGRRRRRGGRRPRRGGCFVQRQRRRRHVPRERSLTRHKGRSILNQPCCAKRPCPPPKDRSRVTAHSKTSGSQSRETNYERNCRILLRGRYMT